MEKPSREQVLQILDGFDHLLIGTAMHKAIEVLAHAAQAAKPEGMILYDAMSRVLAAMVTVHQIMPPDKDRP